MMFITPMPPIISATNEMAVSTRYVAPGQLIVDIQQRVL